MNCHNPLYNKPLPPHKPYFLISTNVERALQINLFMQNEPKSYNHTTIISPYIKRIYNNFHLSGLTENEPKRTQNEPKPQNAKIKLIPYLKRTYSNFRYFGLFQNEPKRTQSKPKTKPNKPNPTIMEKTSASLKNLPNAGSTPKLRKYSAQCLTVEKMLALYRPIAVLLSVSIKIDKYCSWRQKSG